MLLAITDSGLGGLSICAALERDVRTSSPAGRLRLSYVNAWPEEGRGYNDFPDMASRAAVFDRALDAIAATGPDELLIACNTLSILFPLTRFSRTASLPVRGIVEAGVRLFVEALGANPAASIVLLGTRTTIASGEHRNRLVAAGIDPARIAGVSCHGLATAIERDIDGPLVGELIASCGRAVCEAPPAGRPVLVGLCCTHYGYVADRIAGVLAGVLGRDAIALDPNVRMAREVAPGLQQETGERVSPARLEVEVVSKVVLDERTRFGVAGLVRPTSPATADALLAYRHVPDLF